MTLQSISKRRPPARRASAGVGLIEILIAVVILAFGLLGIAALQATALRSSQSSINRNEAVAQSYAILDAMRANRANALIGKYNLATLTCEVPDEDGTLAAADLHHWVSRLRSKDGLGETSDTCVMIQQLGGMTDTFSITVQWNDSRGKAGNSQQPDTQSVVTVSRI
jgi:type IV pilus assembly protein PilV